MPKKCISLPDVAIGIIDTDIQGEFSPRLSWIVQQYAILISDDVPTLKHNEWLCLCEFLRDKLLTPSAAPLFTGEDLIEAELKGGICSKWGVDSVGFPRRIDELSFDATVAIVDVAFRVKQHNLLGADPRLLLKQCGARIEEE